MPHQVVIDDGFGSIIAGDNVKVSSYERIRLISTAYQHFLDQGIKCQQPADLQYCHQHSGLSTARVYMESEFNKYIPPNYRVYEIAASERTISKNYANFWYNRPVIDGYLGDVPKLSALRALPGRVMGTNCCTCLYQHCPHRMHHINMVFSVDVAYYVMRTIIEDLVNNPNVIQMHVMHIPKTTGYSEFFGNEGRIHFSETTNIMRMEARGNEQPYEHPMYFWSNRLSIRLPHRDGQPERYVNLVPIVTMDTGATIYGLYQFNLGDRPTSGVGRVGITRNTIERANCVVPTTEEKIDFSQAIHYDTEEAPKTPGLYKIPVGDGKFKYVQVGVDNSNSKLYLPETGQWTSYKPEQFNVIVRQLTTAINNARYNNSTTADLTKKMSQILTTQSTIGNVNIDLSGDLINIALAKTERLNANIKLALSEYNVQQLLSYNPYRWLPFILILIIVCDVLLYSYFSMTVIGRTLWSLGYILYNVPLVIHLVVWVFSFILWHRHRAEISAACATRMNTKRWLIVISVLMAISSVCAGTMYSDSAIRANCTKGGMIRGLGLESYQSRNYYLRHVRHARAQFHPDKGYQGEQLNSCLDLYKECINDDICFARASVFTYDTTEDAEQSWTNTPFMRVINIAFIYLVIICQYYWVYAAIYVLNYLLGSILRLMTSKVFKFFFLIVALMCVPYSSISTPHSFEKKTIKSVCVGTINPEVGMANDVTWNIKDANGNKVAYGANPGCNCHLGGVKYKHVTKTVDFNDTTPVRIYHPCWANNIAALTRMCMQIPKPDPMILLEFKAWWKKEFESIKQLIKECQPDHIAWFNHLTKKKQQEVAQFYDIEGADVKTEVTMKDVPDMCVYNNFVKSEKQFGATAKTRCICSPNYSYKFVAGPVTYALEQIFKQHFKGYKVPLTWEEQEQHLNRYEELGHDMTVQMDGKFFDLTQDDDLKFIDRDVYETIAPNVTHVDPAVFLATITPEWRTIRPSCVVEGKVVTYGSVKVRGKTFSGSCDTTLMNTIRMACYVRFMLERKGIYEYETWVKGDDTVIFTSQANKDTITTSISELFVSEDEWKARPTLIKGLGQVAKFVKMGSYIDFDFCSTMCIKTKHGYKILRKLVNIMEKEHYSVKIASQDAAHYHNELLISARAWLGSEQTIISAYYDRVHPYTVGLKPKSNKNVDNRTILPGATLTYTEVYDNYEEMVLKERASKTNFTNDELLESLSAMIETDQLNAYFVMLDRLTYE